MHVYMYMYMYMYTTDHTSPENGKNGLGTVVPMLHVVNPPRQHLCNHEERVSESTTTSASWPLGQQSHIHRTRHPREKPGGTKVSKGQTKDFDLGCAVFSWDGFCLSRARMKDNKASPSWPSSCSGQLCTCSLRTISAEDLYVYGALPQHDPGNPNSRFP